MPADLQSNKASAILRKAAEGKYGIPGVCVVCSMCHVSNGDSSLPSHPQYNLEGIIATIRAAEAKRSPAIILLFPWAQEYSHDLLAAAAHSACKAANVPATLHLDHAQTPEAVKFAADTGYFDSIMVDMSHYEKEENLRLTHELTEYCHERGIVTEAEPGSTPLKTLTIFSNFIILGRMDGGEDGVKSPTDLEGILTTAEEAKRFVDTGIDWLAPAFGNVHGKYGPNGVQLDYDRLKMINQEVGDRARLVLHGTDTFDEAIYSKCIQHGITKVNINSVVNQRYLALHRQSQLGLLALTEQSTTAMQEEVERCMDELKSTGKA